MYAGLTLSLGGILFLIAGLPFGILHRTSVLGAVFQTTPWNLIFAGILLLALGSRAHIFGGLLTAPLRFLGYISYGLYLVHILVNSTYDQWVGQLTELPRRHMLQGAYTRLLLISAVSILIAWVSRRFYEERFLRIGTTPGR